MRHEVWFDVDDVLVDTSREIHRVLLQHTGLDIPTDTWPSMLFSQFYGLGKERIEEMRGWWREGKVLEQAQPYETAMESLRHLADTGCRIGLITCRAWHPDALRITEEMAQAHALPVSEIRLLPFGASKADALRERAADVAGFIDDSAGNVRDVGGLDIPSVLVARPWSGDRQSLEVLPSDQPFHAWMETQGHLSDLAQLPESVSRRPRLR